MRVRNRGCQFYLSWFFKLFQCGETGWWPARTPDDRPIAEQDAFFWRCLEIVAQTMNILRLEDMKRKN